MEPLNLKLYDLKEVGKDYIVLSGDDEDVRITFEDDPVSESDNDPPATKEEHAQFFSGTTCQIGLETPVGRLKEPHKLTIFLDHMVDGFGLRRSAPFPFRVAAITVSSKAPHS
jgi:hypothetical protein